MNILSLFGGIECGRQACKELGFKIDKYYSSEIDEYAMAITNYNHNDVIQVGSVCDLDDEFLKSLPKIDLIMGGSPCQNLSSVNVGARDGLAGEKSSLFYEYLRVLNWIKENNNPSVTFLLENVGSATIEDRSIIDKCLGVAGIKFNSQLLSAQNRNRIYWTNIEFEVPKERINTYMQDVLEDAVDDKYYLSDKMYAYIMNTSTGNWQTGNMDINLQIARPLTATMHKMHRADTDNYISTEYQPQGKTNLRKLIPVETERLQTLPDDYTKYGLFEDKVKIISDTQRYIVVGNCWTVEVIKYILSHMKTI